MFTLKAPAKINWFLDVLEKRDDGFHEIRSVIQKISLYDRLTFSSSDEIELITDAQVPTEDNLIYKAACLLKDKYDVIEGARIHLDKVIPMGAGLGGGSSDAASALLGLNQLWALGLSVDDLSGVAADLGSDVPFFLYNSISLVLGRGERIIPGKASRSLALLLVKPEFGIPTAWAYKKLSESRPAGKSCSKDRVLQSERDHDDELTKKGRKVNNIEHFIRIIESAELSGLADIVSNDLESVAIERFPVIDEIKRRLKDRGAVVSMMSGSGSTVFGVFNSPESAEKASRVFDGCWTAVAQTIIDDK